MVVRPDRDLDLSSNPVGTDDPFEGDGARDLLRRKPEGDVPGAMQEGATSTRMYPEMGERALGRPSSVTTILTGSPDPRSPSQYSRRIPSIPILAVKPTATLATNHSGPTGRTASPVIDRITALTAPSLP